jgi:glycosyltransferase involved in cell wall biosynthesis
MWGGHGESDGMLLVTEAVDEGGSERVLEALVERFDGARILAGHFSHHIDLAESPWWAARARLVPLGRHKRHFLGPLYARRFGEAGLDSAHLVVCLAHHGWSLSVPLSPGARLLCYCAGVPRSLYGRPNLYLRSYPPPVRPLLRAAIPALRLHQRQLMQRPDRVLAASRYSSEAIRREYGRDAEVVYPPVRTNFFTPAPVRKRHFLAVGRLVAQKNLEVLLRAFGDLDDTLIVVGRGPWEARLRAMASPNVSFAGRISDRELRGLYRSAHALICPSVEEFGIVMVEAHACGIPVIAPRDGGACEIVRDSATGILLSEVDTGSLAGAVRSLRERSLDPGACRASAERFSDARFMEDMAQIVGEELGLAARATERTPSLSLPVPV